MGRIDRSLHLLDELESLRLQDKVEVMTLGVILDSLGKTKRFKTEYAIEKAESILQKLVSRYQEGSVKRSEKSVGWVFDCVIRLLSKRRSPEAASRVRAIVDEMESLNEAYPGHFEPTPSTYLLAIDALAQSGEANAGKHAMGLLKKVKEPTIRVLASTLSSVARSSGRGIVKTTEKLFQQMLESYRMGDRSASVNARTLTMVLSTILKAPEPDSGERALKVLRQTIELGRENLSDLAPNTIVFNCVLNGLARRKASSDAMSVFEEMKTLQTLGYDSAPDAISYACVSRAIASDYQASTAMERLDEIVAEVRGEIENGRLKSDAQLFNTFIKSYACLSKNEEAAAEKANELLRQLELSTTGDRGISPDLLTYTYVCEACAMSRAPNALNMTEEIFRKAQVLAEQGLIAPLDCDIASYTVLAHTRSKEEDALQRAEQFIEEMEGTRPELLNTRSYNTLLAAYANSNDPDKVARVCAIFGRLSAMNTGGQKNCEPDTGSFNWVS
jgi:pentatricopeptide repeat protein